MQCLNEKFISDEETNIEDDKYFIKRSPSWRSEKLSTLLNKLDKRHFKQKNNLKPSKEQKVGPTSTRLPPSSPPSWAINGSFISTADSDHDSHAPLSTSESPDITSTGTDSSSQEDGNHDKDIDASSFSGASDNESDPEFEDWIKETTGQ